MAQLIDAILPLGDERAHKGRPKLEVDLLKCLATALGFARQKHN
jgi:hypothetical protein